MSTQEQAAINWVDAQNASSYAHLKASIMCADYENVSTGNALKQVALAAGKSLVAKWHGAVFAAKYQGEPEGTYTQAAAEMASDERARLAYEQTRADS